MKEDNILMNIREAIKSKTGKRLITITVGLKLLIIAVALLGTYVPAEFTTHKTILDNPFLNPFAQYDAGYYLNMAQYGYNQAYGDGYGNYSQFPLYSILIKALSFIFGIPWSAFILSQVFSLLAIMILYILVAQDFGKHAAFRACIYLMAFPVAYFFTMMYTESLFLLLIVLMFFYARQEKWAIVGILGFLASLTRMFGIVMILPMSYMYIKSRYIIYVNRHGDSRSRKELKNIQSLNLKRMSAKGVKVILRDAVKSIDSNILWMALIPFGLLSLYFYFFFSTGDFFIAYKTFGAPVYNFRPLFPGVDILNASIEMLKSGIGLDMRFYLFLNVLFGVLFLISAFYSFRLKIEYGLFMIAYYLLATAHTTVNANIRYLMLMFPAYIILAKVNNKSLQKLIWVAVGISLLLNIIFVIRHVNNTIDFIGFARYIMNTLF